MENVAVENFPAAFSTFSSINFEMNFVCRCTSSAARITVCRRARFKSAMCFFVLSFRRYRSVVFSCRNCRIIWRSESVLFKNLWNWFGASAKCRGLQGAISFCNLELIYKNIHISLSFTDIHHPLLDLFNTLSLVYVCSTLIHLISNYFVYPNSLQFSFYPRKFSGTILALILFILHYFSYCTWPAHFYFSLFTISFFIYTYTHILYFFSYLFLMSSIQSKFFSHTRPIFLISYRFKLKDSSILKWHQLMFLNLLFNVIF